MKGDQHWPEIPNHEHVHCHWCNANAVHVLASWPGIDLQPGQVVFGVHNRKGATVPCFRSRGQIVPDADRHQGDPL